MPEIVLTKGMFTVVDDEDYDRLIRLPVPAIITRLPQTTGIPKMKVAT